MAEQEGLNVINNMKGKPVSEYINGIEEFLKCQSKETTAAKPNRALFIVVVDGDTYTCSRLGRSSVVCK